MSFQILVSTTSRLVLHVFNRGSIAMSKIPKSLQRSHRPLIIFHSRTPPPLSKNNIIIQFQRSRRSVPWIYAYESQKNHTHHCRWEIYQNMHIYRWYKQDGVCVIDETSVDRTGTLLLLDMYLCVCVPTSHVPFTNFMDFFFWGFTVYRNPNPKTQAQVPCTNFHRRHEKEEEEEEDTAFMGTELRGREKFAISDLRGPPTSCLPPLHWLDE